MCGLTRRRDFGSKSILLDTYDAALTKYDGGHDKDG